MATGTANIKRYFTTGQQDLTTSGTREKILDLRGGEAVIIKALVGNSGNVYIGTDNVNTFNGFELAPGESLKVEYLPGKDELEQITLYGDCASSGDDICFIVVP